MKEAYNNNYSVLPFYKDTRATQYPNLSYSYGSKFPLYMGKKSVLPFQIYETEGDKPKYDSRMGDYTDLTFYLYNEGGFVKTIGFRDSNIRVKSGTNGDYWIIANDLNEIIGELPIGQYYIRCVDKKNDFTYYSEWVTIVNDVTPYLKIEWRNLENFETDSATIIYENGWKNTLFLPTELGKPEYQFEEEGENRDGHFFPTKQVSYKTYKASFEAPEFLLDAMRLIRLADIVKVTTQDGNEIYADTFLVTPNWQEQGDLAIVSMEVTTDTAAKKCGKAVTTMTPITLNLIEDEE